MQTTKPETTTSTPKQEPTPFPSFGATAGQPFGSFDPMAYWTTSHHTFQKLMQDSYGRVQAFAEQLATVESQLMTRANGAVATWAQLTSDAIAYTAQLSSEARKLGMDTLSKAGARS